jgi:hypothetical protein
MFPLLSLLALLSLMSMHLVRCLLSELDAAGHTDALEIPLLLTSDVIAADIELDQCPLVTKHTREIIAMYMEQFGYYLGFVLVFMLSTVLAPLSLF